MAGLNVIEAAAQTSELKLQSKQNGFTGEHISGNKKLFVKFQASAADSTISRIQNSNKQTLVESIREKDVVTVKINDVTITYYMDAKTLRKVELPNFPMQILKNLKHSAFPKNLHLSGNCLQS